MIDIVEYMSQSRDERRTHLDLSSVCSEIGGNSSIEFKGLLAYSLGTTIPTKQGHSIMLCHACGNSKCSNTRHLYWGTSKDNHLDSVGHGTYANIVARTAQKHGEKFVVANAKRAAKISADVRRGQVDDFERHRSRFESYAPYDYGWITSISKELRISHTHAGRIAKRLGLK
jgi:hypothetical protein